MFAVMLVACQVASPPADDPGEAPETDVDEAAAPADTGTDTAGDTDLVLEPDVPRFSSLLPLDPERVEEISLFRSSVGHDYSDAHEACRSMKHYLCANGCETGLHVPAWTTLVVRAPVSGTVVRVDEEQSGLGAQLAIVPDGWETWEVRLFHVTTALVAGVHVTAGDELGTHASDGTLSDVAVLQYEETGFRLVSFFATLDGRGFAPLRDRGVSDRAALVIDAVVRDADPLVCDGERFVGGDPLGSWWALDPP